MTSEATETTDASDAAGTAGATETAGSAVTAGAGARATGVATATESPAADTSLRGRSSGVVQAVGRRPADIRRRPWESLAIFVVFAVSYSVLGHWLVVDLHVVGFETLDRWARALMVSTNDPPKLAAVGFDLPPLSVLFLAPFAVVPALTKTLAVVPVVSAVFAGFTMVTVNTMMRRAQVVIAVRLAVLAALGLNPLVVMYASTGGRSFLWLALVLAALGAIFAWYVTADIRFVMVAGVAFAVATLAGYGSLVWFLVSLVLVAVILARLGADGTEVEGTTVGLASPTVYVVALWSAFNLAILGAPFHWVTESSDVGTSGGVSDLSFLEILRGTGELVLDGAPIAIVVLPALLFTGVARRNGFALWLGILLLVTILTPGVAVLVHLTDSPLTMDNALPMLLVSVVGAVWLARSTVQGPGLVAAALAAGLALSIPWTFSSMETFRHQGLERAFHDAITTGETQEGTRTLDGSYVGYGLEQEVADYISDHVDGRGSVLTDNASTYAVVLLTGAPELFLDRVDRSDDDWAEAAEAPADHVDYLLLSTDTARDALSRRYPEAAAGDDLVLEQVFANDRYVLVKVPDDYRYGDQLPDDLDADGNGVLDSEESADPDGALDEGGVGGVVGEGPADSTDSTADEQSGGTP
ncbi:hypothetical protein [Nocardioides sp.]|uniref:hypothetical protein n=1 Tax=Nocardioides sp. TaxID=35761 RepID=UPI0027285396|nr:hypothetical protein [Nocardioides sp.]MDO9456313.1 hypothetical protein [Nocardioides sp.]